MRQHGRALLLVLILLLLLGGAAGAYFAFFRGGADTEPPEVTHQLTLSDLIINLADIDKPHYLSASLSLIVAGENPEEMVEKREAHIRDAVLMVVSRHTYEELLSIEGKDELKRELVVAVTEVLAEHALRVEEVLFTDFVMD